ncbi:PBP1A family penicillin-binding protein [Bacillus sp. DNRA2]|uniref:transglycosylase domain-containing protein n=1 Tax=Bacillus sp. DNRA2 TaxID=2723053 RepID=UPI00145E9DDE|nr:PBP1A family penicillin-binding protein [Bacillus sp. DNRA2]NMD69058.1 PBP1A family penicillin-binding protein [Bacillus sp. DNRA2]
MQKLILSLRDSIVHLWKKYHLTKIILLLVLVFILLTISFFAFMASRANVQTLKDGLSQATIIYDKDGEVASNLSTNRTKGITVEQLPNHVKNAVVAIEDERFYEHNGFDVKGIARAFFSNLFALEITGGGSTLTQQLTKNALLSPEQTYKRKLEELFLAIEIEKHYEKDEILQMYLNQVYFGSGAWGIGSASKKYFNKPIEQVTLSEAALLAGLLQSPSARDPYKHYDRAIERRDVVLAKMKELGMITDTDYKAAKNEQIKLEDGGGSYIERSYPYYVDSVLDEAINQFGLTQDEIFTRGYHIYTEMDQNLQSTLEKVYANNSLFPRGQDRSTLVQSGGILLDPKTGGIRAVVGGRGDYVFRGFNRATQLKAQPGSTMKPLAVYTPALEEGYKSTSMLVDQQLSFGTYQPENASRTYQGEIPMYQAVENSVNLPAVWLLDRIGVDKGLNALERFGIPYEKQDEHLAIALGGMHKGISPKQLAEAYSVFANEGKRTDSHFITKIVGPTGKVIAESNPKTKKVTSKQVANEMTSMLLNVVESGTGQRTKLENVQIAGKTGSTQLPYPDINGTKDQWFVGFTPTIVGAVWLGYDLTDREHYLPNSSSDTVVPIFKAIIEQSLPYIEQGEFGTVSVNTKLTEKENTNRAIKEKAEEVKQKAKEIEKIIAEESPKWKQNVEEGLQLLRDVTVKLIDQIGELTN